MHDESAWETILKLKERADEDRYFAERDRELITKLRHAHESEHEDTIRELARFRCPQCGVRLQQHLFHDVTIDMCRTCQGAWLSKERLEAVTQNSGQRWVKDFLTLMTYLMKPPPKEERQSTTTA
jgi:Zn-finger nucleic acid-binding protein